MPGTAREHGPDVNDQVVFCDVVHVVHINRRGRVARHHAQRRAHREANFCVARENPVLLVEPRGFQVCTYKCGSAVGVDRLATGASTINLPCGRLITVVAMVKACSKSGTIRP